MTRRAWHFISLGWIAFGLAAMAAAALTLFAELQPGQALLARAGFSSEGNGAAGRASLFQAAAGCITEDQAIAAIRALEPKESHERVEPRAFIAALNAMPPASAIPEPEALIIFQAPGRAPMMKGFAGGCEIFTYGLQPAVYDYVMRRIRNGAI